MRPVDIIGKLWKLTLPTLRKDDKPVELLVSAYNNYKSPYFHICDDNLVFYAPCSGAKTKNTKYARSELREMSDSSGGKASWKCDEGFHRMKYTIACTHIPSIKPQVVLGQIHDSEDDVVEIRLTGTHLEAIHNSTTYATFTTTYKLGTFVDIEIIATAGVVTVACLGKLVTIKPKNHSGFYFKVGCYVQSTEAGEYGETHLKELEITHDDGFVPKKITPQSSDNEMRFASEFARETLLEFAGDFEALYSKYKNR